MGLFLLIESLDAMVSREADLALLSSSFMYRVFVRRSQESAKSLEPSVISRDLAY
jgi:hypothetical protein